MTNGKIFTTALVLLFGLFFFTHDAKAQTVTGYTSIDWDENTNTVDAYSETDEDYDVNGAYGAYVALTVTDQNSSLMGWQTASDDGTYGFAAVDIQFSGSPGSTYAAMGMHKTYAQMYDYDYSMWPTVSIYYYDFFYFSDFQSQSISQPLFYAFLGSGPMTTRPTPQIILGATLDEAVVQTAVPVRFTYVVSGSETQDFPKSENNQTWSTTLNLPNNSAPCTGSTFDMNVHLHKSNGVTLYGALDPRNIPDTPSDSQYQVMGGGLQGGGSSSPHFDMVLKRITPGNPNRHIRFQLAGYTTSAGFSVTGFVTINCN